LKGLPLLLKASLDRLLPPVRSIKQRLLVPVFLLLLLLRFLLTVRLLSP
jgi:hypothetical protein